MDSLFDNSTKRRWTEPLKSLSDILKETQIPTKLKGSDIQGQISYQEFNTEFNGME